MIELNTIIAHQIVARGMRIVEHSINVMDLDGRIIGSGDRSRLNQLHEGALLAINDNRVVEVDKVSTGVLKGVKPGINLPISFKDQAIGAVGISGEPNKVRQYADFIKMTAELILEQMALMSQLQWDKRHQEELILELIRGTTHDESYLYSIANHLNMELGVPRIAVSIKILIKPGENVSVDSLHKLVDLLEYTERDNLVALASMTNPEVVVLKPIHLGKNGWNKEQEKERVAKLFKRIANESNLNIRIAVGGYFPGISGIKCSYESAKATMEVADTSNSDVLFYDDHVIPVLISDVKKDSWKHTQLTSLGEQLKEKDKKCVLIKTLKVFFEHDCDPNRTCEALHIHRNTLRYRIEKIQEDTSLNLSNINDIIRLYLSLFYMDSNCSRYNT